MAPQRSHERGDAGSAAPAVLLLDPAARVVAASGSAARLVDRSSESLRGLAVSDMFGGETVAVRGWLERLTELREPPPPLVLDLTFVRNDGTRLAFDGVLYAIRTGPAERGEVVAGLKVRPNSGLVVKSELLTAQRRLIERVAARDDLVGSLRDVALFAERVLPGESFCLITPIDRSGVLGCGIGPSLPADVHQLQEGRRMGEASSPGCVAAGGGERLIATDFSVEPSWSRYADALQRHGLIAVWSQPVRGGADGELLAVLEILLPVRRPPSRMELGLLDEIAGMVRMAIELQRLAGELEARGVAQQQAEAMAQDRSRLLDAVVNTALDVVISIDRQGLVTLWNRQAQALFGWTSEETRGRPLSEFIIPPELVKAHEEGMARFRETGYGPVLGRRIEIVAKDRSGRRFPVELSINPIPGTEGGFSAFLRDISERRRIEAAVKTSEERLKLVVDAASDGFWDLRLDGGASMISDRCAEMLGREPSQMPSALPPDHPWVHPDDRASVREAWNAHLQGRTARYESEHRRMHVDGSWRWIREWGKVVERGPVGEPHRVVGTQTDVTERRSLEATLGNAERLESLGLLAGGFAQELDTVLSVIRANVSLASVVSDLPPRVAESLEVVQLSVAKAKAMARSLLDLSPGEGSGRRETVRVSEIVRETLQLMRPTLPRTVQVVVEDRAAGGDWVRVDSGRLQHALINLMLHACESTANAGRMVLRTEAPDSRRVVVACIDSGTSWSHEALTRVFEALGPDGALVDRASLGMASLRRFAESMQGRVAASVTSEGNRIEIELPAAADPSSAAGLTVILHEHHPLLRPMLLEAIAGAGHRVVPVEEPGMVESAVRTHSGALLLIDDMAWDAIADEAWSRMVGEGPEPMLVVMSDRMRLAKLPAAAVLLRRPFRWEELSELVRRFAESRKSGASA